ncbi:alpha/beta fold hydrolase [Rhodanobacter glycinis]|uniref:Pimeloyl-ACP methyl ester carboxylesterase n=1 Tax=Rhodanobacter glycinis TaxID=582702 RepID=A0A1I4G408_9GAMM|nr:alpha/beta hydrolase [Rhodanobacter glycinis]SFL23987.1 Pimeloyl-ACP methyl ester carboxylesterase [Rhodanobacter glycinis]
MSQFITSDGTTLFYRDAGHGQPILFAASWAMDSRAWGRYMLHFQARGFRCIALDRRGHGRSDDPGHGYQLDRLADDLAELAEHLDLRDAIVVTHSMASGECTRMLARHGSSRFARVVFLAPVAPSYVEGSRAPWSMDEATTELAVAAIARDLPQWLAANADDFFLPADTGTTPEYVRYTIDCILDASLQALVECFRAKRVDQRAELAALELPLLVIHGDRDASEPVQQGRALAALVQGTRYLEYAGAPHGLYHTHFERIVADIEAFIGETAAS